MEESSVLEVHLISAQNLKPPSANMRKTETYALVWVDPSTKLRTRVDRFGSENPTWNDKFFFRVLKEFMESDTSAVTVEIYAVGYIRDYLVGTARLLLSNIVSGVDSGDAALPSCTAVGIRRPSGKIQGVLNIGTMVMNGSEFTALKGATAIGYRDFIGKARTRSSKKKVENASVSVSVSAEELRLGSAAESCENSTTNSGCDFSDECDSTTSSSSSSTASTVLKDWNGIRELAGKSVKQSMCGRGFWCGLLIQR